MRTFFIINQHLAEWSALRHDLVDQYQVPIETIHRIPLFDTTTSSIEDLCLLIRSILPKTFINDSLFDPLREGRIECAKDLRQRIAYFLTFIYACQRISRADDADEVILLSDRVILPTKKVARDRLRTYLTLGKNHLRRLLRFEDVILLSHEGISYNRLQQMLTTLTPFSQNEHDINGMPQCLFVPNAFPTSFALLLGKNGAYLLLHNLKCFETSLEQQITKLVRTGTIKAAALAYRIFLPRLDLEGTGDL